MGYNRAQLKQSVRGAMRGTRPNPMLVTLLFTVVVSVVTWLLNTILGGALTGGVGSVSDTVMYYVGQGYEMEEAVQIAVLGLYRMGPGAIFGAMVGGGVLSILVSLWQGVMNVGYEGYALSMVRGENPPVAKIFCAFPQIVPVLVTRILTGLFVFLWTLLLVVAYVLVVLGVAVLAVAVESEVLTVLLMLAATAAYVLGIVWVTLRYTLVDYVLLDQGLSGMDAIRESKRLMQGNAGRAFGLKLSFFGWYLLIAAVVIAGFWSAAGAVVAAVASGSTGGLIASSGFALLMIIVIVIGVEVLSLWLRPYVSGSMAKFYDWTRGPTDHFANGTGAGGPDGWSGPSDYTWSSGTSSGTGMGSAPKEEDAPAPRKPRDDPWN